MRCTSLPCRISASLALAASLALRPVVHAQQQPIQVFLSAVDSEGRPVTDLTAEDAHVVVDGALCTTTRFEAIEWPVKLTLMVDNDPVHTDSLRQIREAVRLFIATLPTDMEVSILSTDPVPFFIYKPGADRVKMLAAVDLLSPDEGAPRFIDAMTEAADRISKDKTGKNKEKANYFPVLMMVGSSGTEGSDARDSQVNRMFKQVADHAITVHVVMQRNTSRSSTSTGGSDQIEIGIQLTKMTGGRYEGINSETRLSTLLPEYGRQIATSHQRQSHQFRITCQPAGRGAPKDISVNLTRSNVSAALTLDGRIP